MMEFILIIIKKIFEHLDLLIPTALTVYGWKVVYREGNRLAKRNETFNLSQIARKILENLDRESEAVWNHAGQYLADLESAKLAVCIAEFELCIEQLKNHYCEISITRQDIFLLRRALTAYPYFVDRRVPTNQERIKDIKIQISDLSLKLMGATYENINNKFA